MGSTKKYANKASLGILVSEEIFDNMFANTSLSLILFRSYFSNGKDTGRNL